MTIHGTPYIGAVFGDAVPSECLPKWLADGIVPCQTGGLKKCTLALEKRGVSGEDGDKLKALALRNTS